MKNEENKFIYRFLAKLQAQRNCSLEIFNGCQHPGREEIFSLMHEGITKKQDELEWEKMKYQ